MPLMVLFEVTLSVADPLMVPETLIIIGEDEANALVKADKVETETVCPPAPPVVVPLTVAQPIRPVVGTGVGAGWVKVNPARAMVPFGAVTDILPLDPVPTLAVILVEETMVYDVAGVPPKLTDVAPVKLVPVMVTVAPLAADVGEKEVIEGAGAGGGVVVPPKA